MSTGPTAYSSVRLHERDKDKHQNEIAILEKKLEKVKSISDETARHLFDAVNRGRRLAQSLGFNDVYDAQFAIDSVDDHDISFRECYDCLHRLDEQLSAEKKETESLRAKLHDAEVKVKELQAQLETRASDSRSRSAESTLREQLKRLNEQHDALKDVKERAAERYKVDYKKWRTLKVWLFTEDAEHHQYRNEPGITVEEKKRRDVASIMRKKQKMIELGPDLARFEGEPEDGDKALTNAEQPPPLGRVEMDSDKENEGTPVPQQKRRISTIPNSANLTSSTAKKQNKPPTPVLARSSLLKSVTNMATPSSSPTVFLGPSSTTKTGQSSTTRVPLTFHPIPNTLHIKGVPSSTPSPVSDVKSKVPLQRSPVAKRPHMANSSDTEDDSQAMYIPITGTPGMNGLFKVPAPPLPSNPLKMSPIQQNGAFRSSIQLTTPLSTGSIQHNPPIAMRGSPDAEDDSSQVPISGVTVHPSLPSRPAFASSSTQEDVHRKALISLAVPMRSREPNREASRPAKVRRVSGDEFGRSDECIPRTATNSIVDTPSTTHSRRSDALRAEGVASAKKDKGKSQEAQNEFTTPAMTRTSGQKRIEDYSAFKGRGRYGKDVESNRGGDTTINAQYTIDPNQNGGLNYQHDLVVRNRDERRRLDAGDCECCREYYEGVGPLPSRLQAPLWCSPPTTPARPCLGQSHSNSSEAQHPPGSRTPNERPYLHRQSDIEKHKKAISRHRHAWARASTPPGYWEIGFPNTQAVEGINEKAKEMHKKKKAEIDKEAGNEAGRYRRR